MAAVFAGLGIRLGRTITKKKPEVVVREVPVEVRVDGPFVLDEARVRELQLTPHEIEFPGPIVLGLSNKEFAERVFVSENTVKTQASRCSTSSGPAGAPRRCSSAIRGD